MKRILSLGYGVAAYLVFLLTFLYAIGFMSGFGVPKSIDTGEAGPRSSAIAINLGLLWIFALQHSVMARKPFKQWWTQYVPAEIERSTYVLLSSLALALLLWQWRPMPQVVWQAENPALWWLLSGLSALGWIILLISTFLLSHFELFGLQQVWRNLKGEGPAQVQFRTPFLYGFVRHPLYLGFMIAFWATPMMTLGHLLFAAASTAYIFIGIALEERDLVAQFGDDYRRYRKNVGMVLPSLRRS